MLEWNVYYHDVNAKKIKMLNVFKHSTFAKEVKELLAKNLSADEFEKELDKLTRYCFWAKCEYEITITGWPYRIENNELEFGNKIDIYHQLHANWNAFVDYVYLSEWSLV